MIQLKTLKETYFKRKTVEALELEENKRVKVAAGEIYDLVSWAEVEGHLFVELNLKIRDRSVWFIWAADAEILKDGQPLVLVSDTKIYEFMALIAQLSDSISKVQNFLVEQMKYKQKP